MILEYDAQTEHGGHQFDQRIPGKTEFPPGWGREEVRAAIEEYARRRELR